MSASATTSLHGICSTSIFPNLQHAFAQLGESLDAALAALADEFGSSHAPGNADRGGVPSAGDEV